MAHPRTSFARGLKRLRGSARALGYRMPAEWEPMARIWLTQPHNAETWPGCLGKAQAQHRAWVKAMRPFVEVKLVNRLGIVTDDSWIRDYGPIFVVRSELDQRATACEGPRKRPTAAAPLSLRGVRGHRACGPSVVSMAIREQRAGGKDQRSAISDQRFPPPKACHDFRFNSWGGKYEEVRDKDDVVPQHIARRLGVPVWIHDMVLEGGSIDVNGLGTVMTTEQCLLNKNRNPRKRREAIVRELHDALGTRHVIWLPGGIIGDDTDGHIDDIARFVDPTTVVAVRAPKGHADFAMLDRNWQSLKSARDQDGRKLNVLALPAPEPIMYKFPPDRFGPGGVNPVPASYANFLIANGGVFVPTFGQKTDDAALRVLERAMSGHKVIGVRAEFLVVGLGSLHCLSQQEPV